MSTPTPELDARVILLRGAERPAPPAAAFRRAGLELLDLVVPDSLSDELLLELARSLKTEGAALVCELEPRRRAVLDEGIDLPLVDAALAPLILNTARTLVALRARGVELAAARIALGGGAAARVGDVLTGLGLPVTQRTTVDSLRDGPPGEVEVFLLPEGNLAGLEEDPAGPSLVGLVQHEDEGILPALARAAADSGRTLSAESCGGVAQALAERAGPSHELPALDDPSLLDVVAPAAVAACWTHEGSDPIEGGVYRDALTQLRSPLRQALGEAVARARKTPRKLVFLDAEEPAMLLAARRLLEEGLAEPVLLGDLFRLESSAKGLGVSLRGMKLHNPRRDKLRAPYAEALAKTLGPRLGLDLDEARRWVEQPSVFGALTVMRGEAHGLVGLIRRDRRLEPLEQLLDVLPLRSEVRGRPGLHLVAWGQGEGLRRVVFADALGPHEATSEELAEAAIQGAAFLRSLGEEEPRVALVADVSYGAKRHPSLERLERARDLVRVREEGLRIDGPLAADVALDATLQERYPGCALEGPANVLVFPGRVAARAALDLLTHTGQAEAIGPLLWGLRHPVGFAERGAGVDDLSHLGLVTTALAIQVDRAERKAEASALSAALEEAVAAFVEAEHAEHAEAEKAEKESGPAEGGSKPAIVFGASKPPSGKLERPKEPKPAHGGGAGKPGSGAGTRPSPSPAAKPAPTRPAPSTPASKPATGKPAPGKPTSGARLAPGTRPPSKPPSKPTDR